MAAGHVQSRSVTGNGSTLSLAYLSANVAGNLLVASVGEGDDADVLTSVGDGGTNTWAEAANFTQEQMHVATWYVLDCAAATPTVQASFSSSVFASNICIQEYDGGDWSLGPTNANGGFGASQDSGNVTTVQNDAVIIGATATSAAFAVFTPDAAFAARANLAGARPFLVQDRLLTTTVTDANTSTADGSGNWAAIAVAFYVAAAAVGDLLAHIGEPITGSSRLK